MARGTDFGGVHSFYDLNLIQQKVDVQPAEPKLNLVNIPGADGTKDMSELPGGRLAYKDRKITWTFALYPGENWDAKHRQVSNALNGKRCKITLDADPDYYFFGRLTVKKYNRDKALRQITIEATCTPWIWKKDLTVVTKTLVASSTFTALFLRNEKKPVVPTIETTAAATIRWKGKEVAIPAGSFTSLDIELQEGDNVLEIKTSASSCTVKITYQEGSL
jgi:hypothetical protein